ncbi:MAG: hypothetical protein [Siphoviridae sp. ctdEk19]|nr:MAG: hypothetical protein [Siphoviridae sp. ctdEk19]
MAEEDFDMSAAVEAVAEGLDLGGTDEAPPASPPSDPEPSNAAPADPTPPAEAKPLVGAAPPATPATTAQAAPRTWKPEAAAIWEQIPEAARAEIARREEDMFRGIEQYKEHAQFGHKLQKVLSPFMPVMQQHGVAPEALVGNLLNAHATLSFGKAEEKLALFQKLAQDYGVDLVTAAANTPYIDPAVAQLREELRMTRGQLSQLVGGQREAAVAGVQKTVNAFADEVGADGQKLRPHFDEVAEDIALLLKAGRANDLQDAYDRAVWANPVTRAKEQQSRETAAAAKAKAEAEKAAAAAKAATAANVRTSARAATASAPKGSMDDTLNEVFEAIQARA